MTVVGGESGQDETPPFPPSKPGGESQGSPLGDQKIWERLRRKSRVGEGERKRRTHVRVRSLLVGSGLLQVLGLDMEVSELWKAPAESLGCHGPAGEI